MSKNIFIGLIFCTQFLCVFAAQPVDSVPGSTVVDLVPLFPSRSATTASTAELRALVESRAANEDGPLFLDLSRIPTRADNSELSSRRPTGLMLSELLPGSGRSSPVDDSSPLLQTRSQSERRVVSREFSKWDKAVAALMMEKPGAVDPLQVIWLYEALNKFSKENEELIEGNGLLSDDPFHNSFQKVASLLDAARRAMVYHGVTLVSTK